MSTCDKCRHWGAERVRAITGGGDVALQARCLVDPARAAPPLMWQWQTCPQFAPQFAPELREYPARIPRRGADMIDAVCTLALFAAAHLAALAFGAWTVMGRPAAQLSLLGAAVLVGATLLLRLAGSRGR